jgi:hypothetical protein
MKKGGEKRMKKRLVSVPVLALLMLSAVAAPVFAESQKWVLVTVTRSGTHATFPTESWITEGNTLHARGGTSGFSNFAIVGESVNLHGYSLSTFDFDINLNNGRGVWHWDITLVFPGGTFEGIVQVDGTYSMVGGFPVSSDAVQSGTFHGTGDYQGWTFKIEIVSNLVTAFMLIP